MSFSKTGKLRIKVIPEPGTYDFVVTEGTTDITFKGEPEGDIHWSSQLAAAIEVRDASGRNLGVGEANLKNIFVLAAKPGETKKGTMSLKEQKLRALKASNLHDYNLIIETFSGDGTVYLKVTTTSTKTYNLSVSLLQSIAPEIFLSGATSTNSLPA